MEETVKIGISQVLSGYEWWQVLVIIIATFVAISTVLILIFKMINKEEGGSVSFFGIKLAKEKKEAQVLPPFPAPVSVTVNTFNEDEASDATELEEIDENDRITGQLSLQACLDETPSFRGEMLLVISRSIRLGREVNKKEFNLIRTQMNAAQVKTDTIKNIFLKEYTNKTIYYKQTGKITVGSYDIFKEFIDRILRNKLLDELRRAFKENHLADYSDETFEEYYCRDHIKRMLENLRLDIFNVMPECITPTVEDCAAILDKNETTFYGYLKEALYEARALVITNEIEIAKISKKFDDEILKLTGIPDASKRTE